MNPHTGLFRLKNLLSDHRNEIAITAVMFALTFGIALIATGDIGTALAGRRR